MREGSEEYLDSEKYELKQRALDGPMLPFIARVNEIRRENPALQHLSNIALLDTAERGADRLRQAQGDNAIIVVVNLDPHHAQEGSVDRSPRTSGCRRPSRVTDLLSGERFDWRIGPNYVRLDPWTRQAHILRVGRRMSTRNDPGHWFEAEPLWFKKAVFYEIHMRGVLRRATATAPATSAG